MALRRVAAGVACIAAACATAAQARPIKTLCESSEGLRKLSDLRYVKPILRVESKAAGVKARDVQFTIAARAGAIRFSPAEDGTLVLPLTDALCAENPDMVSNQPEGSLEFSVLIDAQIPPARRFDYRQLDALRREWEEAISRQSLLWRMVVPSAKGYHLQFEPGRPASAEIHLPEGARTLPADARGNLYIPIEEGWIVVNPAIVLSEMPRRIGLRLRD